MGMSLTTVCAERDEVAWAILVDTMAFVGRLNLVYICIAQESSVHPPYAAMMYCGNPEVANLVAPLYLSKWVETLLRRSPVLSHVAFITLLRGSPNSSHVAFITSDVMTPFKIDNPGICHTESNSVAIHVSIMVTLQMPELSGWRQ
jgi:hypothetical protein